MSSFMGRERSHSTSIIETSNPSFTRVVPARIARTSLHASLKTCMHTLMGVFTVAASVNGILFKIQVLLQMCVHVYGFESAAFQAKQDIHHTDQGQLYV